MTSKNSNLRHNNLTPALEAELRFLRQQVDFWQQAWVKPDASPNAKNRYWHAKNDLANFVRNRREEGYNL